MKKPVSRYSTFGSLNIVNGEILNNPFQPRKLRTQAIQWCLIPENERKIRQYIHKMNIEKNLYTASVDDCFVHILEYFQSENKVFYKDFLTDGSQDYMISKYVFSNLKYAYNMYRSNILSSESEEYKSGNKEQIDFVNPTDLNLKTNDSSNTGILNSIFLEEYTEALLNTSEHLEKYLKYKSYNLNAIIDLNKFVLLLFLKPKYAEISENIQYISEELFIEPEYIETFLTDLKEDYKKGEPLSHNIYRSIKTCMESIVY